MVNNVVYVFVCHDQCLIPSTLNKIENSKLIFVGDKEIDDKLRENKDIIIARDLPNNIEHEKKLLTFTAWYLIVKNNLFLEYDYVCILEYDVALSVFFSDEITKKNK